MDSLDRDRKQFGENLSDGAIFDASQYAFFGNDIVEEVDLGGLEEDDDDFQAVAFKEEFMFDREKLSLNRSVGGLKSAGVISDLELRESSAASERPKEPDFPYWVDRQLYDSESIEEGKIWPSSQPYFPSGQSSESFFLQRTSSYPEKQAQQQQFSSEQIQDTKISFPSYPPPGVRSQQASTNNHSQHMNASYLHGGPHNPLSSPNISSFSSSQPPFPGILGSHFDQHLSPSINANKFLQQQLPHENGLMHPQLMSQQHLQSQRVNRQVQPLFINRTGLQSLTLNPHMFPTPSMMHVVNDTRGQRPKSSQNSRQNMRYPQQFRSKHMSSDELDNILRIQLAATHTDDPYVDDYYYQACLAKKSPGSRMSHYFCPNHLREIPPGARANVEPHAFLQIEALGRVPFSSIRRPRPLLEVDTPNLPVYSGTEPKVRNKPLEKEPMLAARVAIEDGLCLLLDVDDIDRLIRFNQIQDVVAQLRHRRHVMLEGLATSLQLIDPLGKNSHMFPRDAVFLRLVSLPKGKKLLSRYLQLLFPNDELARIVCMGIFRHLTFVFGVIPSESVQTTTNLAKAVSSIVDGMDLDGLSACLAAVACSSEQPPLLRPLGCSFGNEASLILVSVLERAAMLLTDSRVVGINLSNRTLWEASFDGFFGILTKYCFGMYDSVMQSLLSHTSSENMASIGSDAARTLSREMPVEVLRACLPHTNEHQRKMLIDFAQRSMSVSVANGGQLDNL